MYSGADANAKGIDDRTPLHEAAEAGDLHTVELLLKELEKAETVERTRIDATPYDLAYKKGHSEVGRPIQFVFHAYYDSHNNNCQYY